MRSIAGLSALALALALAACGSGPSTPPATNTATAAGPGDTANRIAAMPEGERNGVFIRAIRDADQDCQHVDSSESSGVQQGFETWTAHCSDGTSYTIAITGDGGATVINNAEARLANTAEPAAQPGNAQ